MIDNYEQWTEFIKTNEDPNYYNHLVRFSKEIIQDASYYKHFKLAQKLQMSGPAFSVIKPVLEAINERN